MNELVDYFVLNFNFTPFIIIPFALFISYFLFKRRPSQSNRISYRIAIISALVIISLWCTFGYYYTKRMIHINTIENSKLEKKDSKQLCSPLDVDSMIGDSFGTVNTLFSGLGLVGVIFAIILQMNELKSTQQELSGQKEELKLQNINSNQVRFENSFFNLLETHRVIASKIKFPSKGINKEPLSNGIQSFRCLIERSKNDIRLESFFSFANFRGITDRTPINKAREETEHIFLEKITSRRNILSKEYNKIIKDGVFDSYFRLTYRIIKFIDEFNFKELAIKNIISAQSVQYREDSNAIANEERKIKLNYIGLLRAQMSSYELIALFYNCIDKNFLKSKKLIERYCMFNTIRDELLLDKRDVLFYRISAYSKKGTSGKEFNKEDVLYFLYQYKSPSESIIRDDSILYVYKLWLRGKNFLPEIESFENSFIPGVYN